MIDRYFEWLDGELFGTCSTLDYINVEDGETYFVFRDGEVCNSRYISKMTTNVRDLAGKMLVEVPSPRDLWKAEKIEPKRAKVQEDPDGVEVPTLADVLAAGGSSTASVKSNVGMLRWVAPEGRYMLRNLPTPDEYPARVLASNPNPSIKPVSESVPNPDVQVNAACSNVVVMESEVVAPKPDPSPAERPAPVVSQNPVAILVQKCQKHPTDVNLTISLDLPPKSLFEIAATEFTDGADDFMNEIINSLDPDMILQELKIALLGAYRG